MAGGGSRAEGVDPSLGPGLPVLQHPVRGHAGGQGNGGEHDPGRFSLRQRHRRAGERYPEAGMAGRDGVCRVAGGEGGGGAGGRRVQHEEAASLPGAQHPGGGLSEREGGLRPGDVLRNAFFSRGGIPSREKKNNGKNENVRF